MQMRLNPQDSTIKFRPALASIALAACAILIVPAARSSEPISIDKDSPKVDVSQARAAGKSDTVSGDSKISFAAVSGEELGKMLGLPNADKKDAKDARSAGEAKDVKDAKDAKDAKGIQKEETAGKAFETNNEANQSAVKDSVAGKDASASRKPAAMQKGKASLDDVSKTEIGVDWSHWVSVLADRWYFNLKNMEIRSGRAYRTLRPALIRFTCYRSGRIGNICLRQSCGTAVYDQMQMEALRRCIPLPPFPEGSRRMSYTLMEGWECHSPKSGETEYKPGSFDGKNFPAEKVPLKKKAH